MNKKVVVTGGAGFIGSHLVDKLIELGYEVYVIDNLTTGKKENVNPKATLHQVDICSPTDVQKVVTGAEFVFHLAAIPSVPYSIEEPVKTNDVNINGTLNVLIAAKEAGVKRVVYSASSAAYGEQGVSPQTENMLPDPKHPYGVQKHVGELYCKAFSESYDLPTVSLRYFNVYGPRQNPDGPYAGAVPKFIDRREKGEAITIFGDGEQTRDFVHVSDVVAANIKAAESDVVGGGEVINIGGGWSSKIIDVAKLVGGPIEYLPPRIEVKDSLADISLAKKLLDWEPSVKMEDGITELKKLAGLA